MQIGTGDLFWRAYTDGPAQAPPLVLLHGFAQGATSFKPLLPVLSRTFRVLRLDLPGHGETRPRHEVKFDWPRLCGNLHEAVAQLDERPAHWFGYSQGGRVALMAALAQPERVHSLALLGASTGIADPSERARRTESDRLLAQNITRRGLEWFTQYWEALPIFATQRDLPEPIRTHIRDERNACDPHGLALALETYGTATMPDCFAQLTAWTKPLWLGAGELDAKFVASNARSAAAAHASLLYHATFPAAGHAAHLERPVEFTQSLIAFFSAAQGLSA